MKSLVTFFLLVCCLSVNAQQKKNGVVKINGDTVWCDEVEIRFNGKNQVKVAKCTGGAVSEVDGMEIAFIIYSNRVEIVSESHYIYGRVLIWGKNYYLASERNDDGVEIFQLLDKNRKYIKKMKTGKSIFEEIKEYFGDCEAFIAEIDKALQNFNQRTYRHDVVTLASKYTLCSEK